MIFQKCTFIGVRTASKFLLGLAVLTGGSLSAHAGAIPISFTGWNADVIAEATASNPSAATNTTLGSVWAMYEAGAPLSTQGLPVGGSFTSALDGITMFKIASYTANNVVNNNGTIVLNAPAKYTSLSFLVEGINDSPAWSAVLHFSDSTTQSITGATPTWTDTGSGQVALSNFGLTGMSSTWNSPGYAGAIALFQSSFNLGANSSKVLASIDFSKTSGEQVSLFAVSGVTNQQVAPTPEPSSLALMGFGLMSIASVIRRKQ